jgi:vacuolar-type H+-ATPase subunit I/STV1
MKPNFDEMSKAELKAYVLSHRDDDEALRVLFSRRNPPDSEATWYGPMCTPEGVPIEENIRIAEEAIRQRAERDRDKQREKELQKERELEERLRQEIEQEVEARLRQKIEQERVSSGEDNMTTVTLEEIEQFREQLRDYPEASAALDIIEEWDGDLADAAESIATRNGIEGVEDNADLRWFFVMLVKIRDLTKICEPENQNFRENYLPALIPPIADVISSSFGCPPGIASLLATPFALYIKEEGIEQFCQMSLP